MNEYQELELLRECFFTYKANKEENVQKCVKALPTVEKRMAIGVLLPMCSNIFALQYLVMS